MGSAGSYCGIIKIKGWSPPVLLATVFVLALGFFALVRQFHPWLHVTMDIHHYLVFHNIAESFSIMVSLSIFGIGWFSYPQSRDRKALFLSCAFLTIGILDGMHTLGYAGMPDFITVNSANKSTQFWITARLFTALAFLASAWISADNSAAWPARLPLLAGAFAFPLSVFVAVTWFPAYLPATFREPDGLTPVKVYGEYVVITLFVVSFLVYCRRFRQSGDRLLLYYLPAFILCIFSELAFTVYKSAFDTYNVLGHLYKALAFFLIYQGVFAGSIIRPYREAVALRQDLAASEAHYRRLADNAPDMIYRMSLPAGVYEYVSPASRAIFGYDPVDFYNSPLLIRQAIHPDWQGYFVEQWANLLKGEMPPSYEYRILHPTGGARWLHQRNVLVRDTTGKPVAIEGIVTDITSRKESEEHLVLWKQIFQHAGWGVVLVHPREDTIMAANQAFAAMHGFEEHEVVGMRLADFFAPASRAELSTYYRLAHEQGRHSYESSHLRKDGSQFPVLAEVAVIRDAVGQVIYLAANLQDITTRHQAEDKIRTAHEELSAINRIIMACASSLDADAVLGTTMDEALRITGLEGGAICYVTPDNTLDVIEHRATSQATIEDLTTHAVKVGDCLCGECARNHKPLILRDREAVLKFSTQEATRGEDIRFHAAFPLITGQRCVGVLCVFTRTDIKPSENSLRLLETVSAQIAMAIDNARLYNESIQHATTLEEKVQQRTFELEGKNAELERFNKLFVDRELKMVELKERIQALHDNQPDSSGSACGPVRS